MNSYQQEQRNAHQLVLAYLQSMPATGPESLIALTAEYLGFRKNVNAFFLEHFSDICTLRCYQSQLSACCSKEGIIVFFADVVVNGLVAKMEEIDSLIRILDKANEGFKCIYLGPGGCRWRLKPIVCEMFICDSAQEQVFNSKPDARREWEELKQLKKRFTWPDQPVLFDTLETIFLEAGYRSPLMYLHNSPGLLRLKQQALKTENGMSNLTRGADENC